MCQNSAEHLSSNFGRRTPSSRGLPNLNFVNGHFQNFRMYLEYKNIIVEKFIRKLPEHFMLLFLDFVEKSGIPLSSTQK